MSYPPKFEDIEVCLRARHRQVWQLARELSRKLIFLDFNLGETAMKECSICE